MTRTTCHLLAASAAVAIAAAGASCGGALGFGGSDAPDAAPGELRAAGSLRNIHLAWIDSPGATGYVIYRSTAGSQFDRITPQPIAETRYDDAIASPAGDGVVYRYRVTAVADGADGESPPSEVAGAMHGTRLAAAYPDGFVTQADASPYVADTTTVLGGDLWVTPGTQLHMVAGAVLDFEVGGAFLVDGLLRAIGTAPAPVTVTAHRTGARYLPDGEGWFFAFHGAPFDPATGAGSRLDHVQLTNLGQDRPFPDLRSPIRIVDSGIALEHTKLVINGSSALRLDSGGWIILRNCLLDGLGLEATTDLSATPFELVRSITRGGANQTKLVFRRLDGPVLRPGQIGDNDIDSFGIVLLDQVTGAAAIPLGGNYWSQAFSTASAPPFVLSMDSTATVDFSAPAEPLRAPPPGAGPDW